MRKRANGFVREYLERVSWKVLDAYRPVIRQLTRGHASVYALYKGEKLYCVGLASNLMSRVNHHLKDRHKGKWVAAKLGAGCPAWRSNAKAHGRGWNRLRVHNATLDGWFVDGAAVRFRDYFSMSSREVRSPG